MGGSSSKSSPTSVGTLAKRATMGVAGIISFYFGIFEFLIVAILTSIIAGELIKLPSYNTDTNLQNARKGFIGFTVIFWLSFAAGVVAGLLALWFLVYLSIPIVYIPFIIANFIFTIGVLILAIYTIIILSKTPEYEGFSENVQTIQNTCIATIVIISISLLIFSILAIFSIRNYRISTDVAIGKAVVQVAAPEAAPLIAGAELLLGAGGEGEEKVQGGVDLVQLASLASSLA